MLSNAVSLLLGEVRGAGANHDVHLPLTEPEYRQPAGEAEHFSIDGPYSQDALCSAVEPSDIVASRLSSMIAQTGGRVPTPVASH